MSYSTRTEVRDMVKDDALNAIIGDTFIEDPAEVLSFWACSVFIKSA